MAPSLPREFTYYNQVANNNAIITVAAPRSRTAGPSNLALKLTHISAVAIGIGNGAAQGLVQVLSGAVIVFEFWLATNAPAGATDRDTFESDMDLPVNPATLMRVQFNFVDSVTYLALKGYAI